MPKRLQEVSEGLRENPQGPPRGEPGRENSMDAAFLLTVGSFLLTVELLYL